MGQVFSKLSDTYIHLLSKVLPLRALSAAQASLKADGHTKVHTFQVDITFQLKQVSFRCRDHAAATATATSSVFIPTTNHQSVDPIYATRYL